MNIHYLGHSCFLVETGSHRLIIDPFLTGNPLATATAEQIKCDYVLLTHGHEDHFGDAVEIAKANDATVIANFETAMVANKRGAKAHPMQPGGAWQFPFGRVKFTIAHHSSSLDHGDGFSYMGNPAGILITVEGKTIYHAGDTALFLDMKLIGELDRIDLAMLPIGDNFTMGPEDAARAVEFLNAKVAIPMHYGTFPLIDVDPQRFIDADKTGAARILERGATYQL